MFQIFWKQLEGWGTDFIHKYQYDIFFRTKLHVVCLEFIFVGGIFILLWLVLQYKYEGMHQTIAFILKDSLKGVQSGDILFTGLIFLIIAIIFGYIISYIALKPTRDSLASQKQFIGNIAHELRTPLSIIKTNMEVALLEDRLDDKMREALIDNVDELDRTSDIINNLLSFNILQNPELISFKNINLENVLDKVEGKLLPLASGKNITISVQKGEFLTVWGNVSALEQIMTNVIKNALAYTAPGGFVDIFLNPNYRGYIELTVSDNGVGISRNKLLHVFEPFYRAEQSRSKQHGGSGLGLTIVSELIKLHSGKISINSKRGVGTTVCIALPCGEIKTTTPIDVPDDEIIARDFSTVNRRKNFKI